MKQLGNDPETEDKYGLLKDVLLYLCTANGRIPHNSSHVPGDSRPNLYNVSLLFTKQNIVHTITTLSALTL